MAHGIAMRSHYLPIFLLLFGLSTVFSFGNDRRPNIIFILADDLGWAELGCYGNDFNETPHLDQMAAEGLRFTQAYAAAPVCSPYRAALMTGKHPARVGILDYLRPDSANGLSPDFPTLPGILRDHGYATGMVGKWHLTGYEYHDAPVEIRPIDRGFSWNVGSEIKSVGNGANFFPYVFRTQPISWIDLDGNPLGTGEYLTDRLNLEAVDFIEAHSDEPFFLYLSHYAPHTILNGRPDLVEKYKAKRTPGASTRHKCYLCEDAGLGGGDPGHHWAGSYNPHLAAMLESIDDGVGKIRAKLEQLGIAEDTLIVFSSDNGGETNVTSNAPLRGGKSQLYEGGIRVPLVMAWPGRIPAASETAAVTQNVDFLPTFLTAADVEKPAGLVLDGQNIYPAMVEPHLQFSTCPIYWHYPLEKPHFLGGTSSGAIRVGNWKLVEHFDTGQVELFNLRKDLGESRNIATEHPSMVRALRKSISEWRERVDASMEIVR